MEEKNSFMIFSAPIQGLTDPVWRHFHHQVYGGGSVAAYHTPFMRVERGEVRRRDVRDLKSEFNQGLTLVPQIIFRDIKEFRMLCDEIRIAGYSVADMNMGCPFPPQVHHGRGAGILGNIELLREVSAVITAEYGDLSFSAKMRLGVERPDEWRDALAVLNTMPLRHVTVHPRTARQQYSGDVFMDEFAMVLGASAHPVIYNGDIVRPEQIDEVMSAYPGVAGVMIGRGLFSRPSIVEEWQNGVEWDLNKKMEAFVRLHNSIYSHYCDTLCGDVQILGKMKPFWEYMAPNVDRKAYKDIKKASSLRKYDDAVGRCMRINH
ncbi:tRNA-dihydrouridine synthase family protein [uncultured Duncaniella sp.]|uniref:tRNA-dihydrouridine synthase family protein n=1 Tax=uncultured Duncaniella sp. TaxID=2768039 RepID=UPI0025A953E7|nr:tRNA-dihydrouridine synthase family protein [uncultured Duncaniella sp.]